MKWLTDAYKRYNTYSCLIFFMGITLEKMGIINSTGLLVLFFVTLGLSKLYSQLKNEKVKKVMFICTAVFAVVGSLVALIYKVKMGIV